MKNILILIGCFLLGVTIGLVIIFFSTKTIRRKFEKSVRENEEQWNKTENEQDN